jgi:hypothetical protein
MARSVAAAARAHDLDERDAQTVERALRAAMQPRIERLADDHHPAYLHPGRTALILLRDVGAVDAAVLGTGMLHDSGDAPLRVTAERVSEILGAEGAAAVSSIPLPGDERLVERLIGLERGIALAALAERLDQLRHLHLREDLTERWAEAHDEAARAWLPTAARTHPVLGRRYAHWTRTFARRVGGQGRSARADAKPR